MAVKKINGKEYDLQNTNWQQEINNAVAKGDMAAAAQFEQARNDKINSGNYAGKQSTTSNFSQYLNSGSSNKTASNKASGGSSSSTGVDYSRRQDLKNQSVKQGNYTVYYDELGYATKAIKDGGAGAAGYDPAKMDNLNYLAGGNSTIADMVDAAQKGNWDLVGDLSNSLGQKKTYADGSEAIDLGYANDVMDLLTDLYKYNAEDYYKGKYDSVYGEGAWDGAQQPTAKPTVDALESLLSGGSYGGSYGGGSFSSAPPEYEGSKWDSVLDSLAQQLLEMTYEDWTQGDQYKALADRYGQQGKMSMQDVLGQMASRTGGLASSYATTAAQQQFNSFMGELERAAREMYGLEQDDLLEKAQMAQKYSQEDYDRYLDAWNHWADNRNFEYDAWRDSVEDQRYTDAYTDKMAQQEKADLLDMAETMAAYGDFSGYKALGYTDEQIATLTSGYQAQLAAKSKSSGGGGGGNPTTSKPKLTLPQTLEALENGIINESTMAAYEYYYGQPYDNTPDISSREDAIAYLSDNGVSSAEIAGLMTENEWKRRKSSLANYGQGGAEVTAYDSYEDYLVAYTQYLLENNG